MVKIKSKFFLYTKRTVKPPSGTYDKTVAALNKAL